MARSVRRASLVRITVMAAAILFTSGPAGNLPAQRIVELDLDSAVGLVMAGSYRIRQLEMGIERTRYFLKSRQASLKSRVYMNLQAPQILALSETKWNSDLRKDEIIHTNTRRWQMDLSVSQPVILLGYPTNGYLSLNNKIYKYIQADGIQDVDFYNRFFVKFEQPFLLPNNLKNNIEDAELDLERNELDYVSDRVRLIEDVADDYYDLFEVVYKSEIYRHQIHNLERVERVAAGLAGQDTSQAIAVAQVRVELANTREQFSKTQSDIRREAARIKQRLQLEYEDSVYLVPSFEVQKVDVDVNRAIEYGYSLRPSLRRLDIDKRKSELDLNNSEGGDAFHFNLEMTYGLERKEDQFAQVWDDYDGSYSVSVSAYVPLWDWGRRKARIDGYRMALKKTELYIEENRDQIRSDIINAVANLEDYQKRVLNMMESADMVQEITDFGLTQYESRNISLQDVLQMVTRQKETELNFLDAYLGFRRSLMALMVETYYDYENDISLLDKFRKAG
ncbi:MAG: TolC family protein [Candidatus Glassbacteria bacterium]